MKDFAAAAMLKLVRLGLQRARLAEVAPPAATGGALVPLLEKRQWLALLLQRHGPALLLRLGEAVHDAEDEPTLTALTVARTPLDLIARWQRLERFVHSRHRVVVLSAGEHGCCLRHVSVQPHEAPLPAEDLLVFGVLVGLLQRVGTVDLRARFAGEHTWTQRAGHWGLTTLPDDTATWELAWQPSAVRPNAAPVPHGAAIPDAARALLAADCGAPWTLPGLAQAMGLPPRTLQRRLAAAGTSFSSLWNEVRLARAAQWLVTGHVPAAQVGYLCGFADQAHFTRSFKRHSAMTPAVYRTQFGQPSVGALP